MALILKPFSEMTSQDYRDIGLKVGLEIHQQLLTDKKLFCRCPAGKYTDIYNAEILRHMRPTLSELGEYDGTALMEFKTKKEIIYRINHESVCTYEMDDTPPFEVNDQALDSAIEIAILLNYQLINEIHIARKQYLDGSIPAGFQRTTIVGISGWVPFKGRKIDLIQLGLEEDACREVSDIGHERIYKTDRLGMPLIEIVTEPQMYTPQDAAEVGNLLRWTVRGMGNVRTGLGAGRQDVNVSIDGGTRIEIKGVSRIPNMPLLIYNEACRQYALLKIRDDLHKRGITEKTFRAASTNVTQLISRTEWDPIRQAIQRSEQVHCVNLKGFLGMLSHPTQTGKVFSREISDRVRVIACLTRLPNILTSESTEETIEGYIWQKVRKACGANSNDALVLVWGDARDVVQGVEEIIIRAKEATIGVPSETRQALADGANGFERILPGANRMYPDTDLPPLEITKQRVKSLHKNIGPPFWSQREELEKLHVPEYLLTKATLSEYKSLFIAAVSKWKLPTARSVHLLFEETKNWSRQQLPLNKISEKDWESIFTALGKSPALWDVVIDIIKTYLSGEKEMLELSGYEKPPTDINLKKEINTFRKEAQDFPSDNHKKHRYFMGRLMKKYGGLIPGSELTRNLNTQTGMEDKS